MAKTIEKRTQQSQERLQSAIIAVKNASRLRNKLQFPSDKGLEWALEILRALALSGQGRE